MTNEEMLGVADIVERATNRFNAQAALYRERFDEHVKLIASIKADHEAKMVEHRAAFGARTEADAKIIAGLREESAKCQAELDDLYQREGIEKKRRMDVEDERDALRAEVAALQERLRASIARGDFAQMEVAALKSQSPHPVKVGEWVRRTDEGYPDAPTGYLAQVLSVSYRVRDKSGGVVVWNSSFCEPCDPPATHDTEAGKASAESALEAEPVADEIKVGDVVEVVSNTGGNTWLADVGSFGTVTSIETLEDSLSVRLKAVPDKKNVCGGYVSICDVRKVTT